MLAEVLVKGDKLRFTRDVHGYLDFQAGDTAVYLGDSQVIITSGEHDGLVFGILISAPLEKIS
jgi:hypothetical protein